MPELVSAETWRRIQPLLDRALTLTASEQSVFLNDVSSGDATLRAELEQMVRDCSRLAPLLERPAFERFQSLMEPQESTAPALTEGSMVGDRYVIERVIGQGGSATVYLARDVKHDRPVALKVLHSDLAAGQWAERFFRETHLTSRLQHPNILPLHDSGEVGTTLYCVMPFVEGESLRHRINREHQLAVSEAVRIVRDVARALDYAHGVGFLHRDVKPENILLSNGQPLLADFGIASSIAGTGDSLTKTGFVLGTPVYMAPEQASSEGHVDGRSDLYALACVLYELLTGQPPYSGPTAQSIMLQHMGAAAPSPGVLRPGLPPALAEVVRKALAKRPVDRFATGAEFALELEQASAQGATRRRWRAGLISRRARWIIVSVGGIICVAGAAALWALRTDSTDALQRSYNIRRPESAKREAAVAQAFDAAPAPGVNIAAGRPSFQSSTHDPMDPAVVTRAFKANDGGSCAFFSCGGTQHTDFETNAWWYVDLGLTRALSGIRIYNIRTIGPTGRLFPSTVSVHADGQQGFTAFGAPAVWTGVLATQPNPDPLVYDFAIPPGTNGRYVKVQLNGMNWLHMAEVEVFR